MAVKAFSDEFAAAFRDEINKSSAYKQAGKGWKWTVGLVVEAEPEKNVPEPSGLLLDLWEGEARSVKVLNDFHHRRGIKTSQSLIPVNQRTMQQMQARLQDVHDHLVDVPILR